MLGKEYLPEHYTPIEDEPYYRGPGEHSVASLENLLEKYKEILHQKNVIISEMQRELTEIPNSVVEHDEQDKVHVIVTVEDIINVLTDDNKERFMTDLFVFGMQMHEVKQKYPDLRITHLKWKDDGNHAITAADVNGSRIEFTKNNG